MRQQIARWATDHLDTLRQADPELPPELSDRDCDNWEPLLAIADLAGGRWPHQARQAALALSGLPPEDDTPPVLLLGDIQEVSKSISRETVSSSELVEWLVGFEHRPWGEWNRGRPVSAVQVARLLRSFGIRPRTIRLANGSTAKGYHFEDFKDDWSRYLPLDPSQPSQPNGDAAQTMIPDPSLPDRVTASENAEEPRQSGVVTHVTHETQGSGREVNLEAALRDAGFELEGRS